MIRILVSDRHEIARHGIKSILRSDKNFDIVGEVGGDIATISALTALDVNVLIIDPESTSEKGIAFLKELREIKPNLAIYLLVSDPNIRFARLALAAGAMGFSGKEIPPPELVNAIRLVASGRPSIGDEFALHLMTELCPRNCGSRTGILLSPREHDIYCRLARGETYSSISKELGLSVKTIATHKANIFVKLQIASMSALIQHAISNEMLPAVCN